MLDKKWRGTVAEKHNMSVSCSVRELGLITCLHMNVNLLKIYSVNFQFISITRLGCALANTRQVLGMYM